MLSGMKYYSDMRHKVNDTCNVLTGDHSDAYRSYGQEPAPQITVPHLRLRLSIYEAERLATALAEAVAEAKRLETQTSKCACKDWCECHKQGLPEGETCDCTEAKK